MTTKRVTKLATPSASSVSAGQCLFSRLHEPSTWAGLLTLGAAFENHIGSKKGFPDGDS